MIQQCAWKDNRGFTLIEVLLVILLMGILMAIASSSWLGAVESRRVDDGTNRLAADLRYAHSKAINRLASQTVTVVAGSSNYTMGPTASSCSVNPTNTGCVTVDLDDSTNAGDNLVVVNTAATITFNADGSATLPGNVATLTRTVSSADGNPHHNIVINSATSRVQIVP